MRFQKRKLADLPQCYAVGTLFQGGQRVLLAVSEGENKPCIRFSGPDFSEKSQVWDGPGGAIALVPVPGTDGEFLSIQKFFRLWQWEGAEVCWVYPQGTGYKVKRLATLPYVHRIDIFDAEGVLYFLGCTATVEKDSLEEWKTPGQVLVGTLDTGARSLSPLRVLRDDFWKNHGYFRPEGANFGLIGCDSGVYRITPPRAGEDWRLEQLLKAQVSDMALADLDGDGGTYMATIEDFHGPHYRVYHLEPDGFRQVYEHPEVCELYHVAWGGRLLGRGAFLGGCRRGKKELFALAREDGEFCLHLLDTGVGPSNVCVFQDGGRDYIFSANREIGEAALYTAE